MRSASVERPGAIGQSRSRYLGLVAFAIILFVATMAIPIMAGASTYRGGFSVTASGSAIDGNLYVGSFRSRIETDVRGDLSLASFTSSIQGNVEGSVHLFGARATIQGDVGGSVYVASGNVDLEGTVGGDLIVGAGRVTLSDGSRVEGDVVVLAGQLRSRGEVAGDLHASALLMDQEGTVGGNVEAQVDRLSVSGEASIGGSLRYQSPTEGDISSGSTIGGETTRTNATPWTGIGEGALAPFGPLLKLTWSLLAGAALVGLAPRLMSRFAETASPVVQPALVGAVGLVSIPVFATIAMVSVLGIPIGVLGLGAYLVALYLSQIVVGLAIGRFLLPRRWRDGSRGYLLLAMTIGVILIGGLRMVPVPFVNMGIVLVVTVIGLGGVLLIVQDLTSERLRASRV